MSRPPSPSHRPAAVFPAAALAACAALAALGGCRASQVIEECPGLPVAVLHLKGIRMAAACQGDTAPSDGDKACAARTPPVTANCQVDRPVPDCCFDTLFKQELDFQATVAYGQLDATASFCLPVPGASPYPGTRSAAAGGDQVTFSLETSGAVLASCSSTCAVTVQHQVTGLVARDPESGAVTGFTGESVEAAAATPAATCAPCSAPCSATWALAGTP